MNPEVKFDTHVEFLSHIEFQGPFFQVENCFLGNFLNHSKNPKVKFDNDVKIFTSYQILR